MHPSAIPSRDRPPWWPLVMMVLLGLAARIGYLEWTGLQLADRNSLQFDDEKWYWHIAESIHRGQGIVGEFGHRVPRMPLYPVFLSCFAGFEDGVLWAKRAQCLLGVVPVVLISLVARRMFGPTTAHFAALIMALDPLLVGACSLLLTETVFVVLSTVMLALWFRANAPALTGDAGTQNRVAVRTWLIFTAVSSAAIYTRPSSLPLLVAWLGMHVGVRRFQLRAIATAAVVGLGVLMTLLPWGFRNQRLTGHFTLLDHRAGITLYDSVGPLATGASDLGDIKNSAEVRNLSEAEWDAYFRKKSWESIRSDPVRVGVLAVKKLGRMWSPILNAREYQSSGVRIIMAGWTIPFYLASAVGIAMLRRRWPVLLALLTPMLVLSAVHAVYIGSVRYRLGATPALAILAALAFASAFGKLRPRTAPIDESKR